MVTTMVSLPGIAWIAIGAVIASAALAMLHALASAVRNEHLVQELRAKTAKLRSQYRKRLAEDAGEDVLIVDEAPVEPVAEPARLAA